MAIVTSCLATSMASTSVLRSASPAVIAALKAQPLPWLFSLGPVAIEEFVHLEGVNEKTKDKILWDNCARLYNFA